MVDLSKGGSKHFHQILYKISESNAKSVPMVPLSSESNLLTNNLLICRCSSEFNKKVLPLTLGSLYLIRVLMGSTMPVGYQIKAAVKMKNDPENYELTF